MVDVQKDCHDDTVRFRIGGPHRGAIRGSSWHREYDHPGKQGARMSSHRDIRIMAVVAVAAVWAASAMAFPKLADSTKRSCATCHSAVAGGAGLTEAGKAYKADATKVPAANVEGANYVSSNKCKTCHLKEYKSWLETPHAKGLATLSAVSAEKAAEIATKLGVKLEGAADKSEACLQCHVTGHGQPGGYPGADSTKTAGLSGVTCENCHGPGSAHVAAAKEAKKAAINGKVGENFCKQCHTPTMSPKFDHAIYVAKGLHAKKVTE